MEQYELRPHQKKMHKLLKKALKEKGDHILFQAPTGFGKSVSILHLCTKHPGRIIVMAPTRKLVKQLEETLISLKPVVIMGTILSGDPLKAKVIITTPQTLNSRLGRNPNAVGDVSLVVVDEAHHGMGIKDHKKPPAFIRNIYDRFWSRAKWVGFTATPITMQGHRLEGWDYTISKYSTAWLIKKGWLAKYRYFAKPAIDMSPYKVQNTGDYSGADIEAAALKNAAVESVIKHWSEYTKEGRKKSMIFAASIEHAEVLTESIEAVIVHSKMKEEDIEKAFDLFKHNKVTTIISVNMLTAGFDDPSVEVQILARGTASKRLAIQMWGRVLRQHPDIPEVKILDLAGVYESVGIMPDTEVNFNLVKGESKNKDKEEELLPCPACYTVVRKSECERVTNEEMEVIEYLCPSCGAVVDEKPLKAGELKFEEVDELIEIKPLEDKLKNIDLTMKLTDTKAKEILSKLRSRFAPRTKQGWEFYLWKAITSEPVYMAKVFKGNIQGIISDAELWREIMDVKDRYNA